MVLKNDLRLVGRPLCSQTTAFENARSTLQRLLLPILDLVWMDPELTRQLGDRPVALDRRQRRRRIKPALYFLGVPFVLCSRAIGGPRLS